jgi:hypothetical protein
MFHAFRSFASRLSATALGSDAATIEIKHLVDVEHDHQEIEAFSRFVEEIA